MGFSDAATVLFLHLSPEAAANFADLVKEVAGQYFYDDSLMLKALNNRLKRAVRHRQPWAEEVAALLARDDKPQLATV
jgi:hypothetical protein